MQWVKIPLILAALALLVVVFRRRRQVGFRAGTRIVAILLAGAAVVSIADPNIPQAVAQALGVARGTDLVLYLLVVVFAMTSLGFYLRLQESDQRIRTLARAMAIQQALEEGPPSDPRTLDTSRAEVAARPPEAGSAPGGVGRGDPAPADLEVDAGPR